MDGSCPPYSNNFPIDVRRRSDEHLRILSNTESRSQVPDVIRTVYLRFYLSVEFPHHSHVVTEYLLYYLLHKNFDISGCILDNDHRLYPRSRASVRRYLLRYLSIRELVRIRDIIGSLLLGDPQFQFHHSIRNVGYSLANI